MSDELKVGGRVRVTERTRLPGCQPGEQGTVRRRSASTTGEPVYVVALDEEDSGLEFYFLADEIEPAVGARSLHPTRHPAKLPPRPAPRPSDRGAHRRMPTHGTSSPAGGRRKTTAPATGSPACARSKGSSVYTGSHRMRLARLREE